MRAKPIYLSFQAPLEKLQEKKIFVSFREGYVSLQILTEPPSVK